MQKFMKAMQGAQNISLCVTAIMKLYHMSSPT